MSTPDIVRRNLVMGAVATGAVLSLRNVTAQTANAGGDWLAIVKSHHVLIAKALEQAIAAAATPGPQLTVLLQHLGFLLTAHSVGEENSIYPELATRGITIGAAELYLEQDAQKVLNAQINMSAMGDTEPTVLVERLKTLKTIVLDHALRREELELYPALHRKLSSTQNAQLTESYARFFSMVKEA